MTAIQRQRARILTLHESQGNFIDSQAYISALLGGRGAGKTFAGASKVILQAKDKEPWMSISPDSGVILDTTLPTFLAIARKFRKLVRYVKSPYPRVWFRTQDGGIADIIMKSGERPEKIRGPNKAGLWIDEASIQVEDVFEIGIGTLRIEGASNQVFMTMTPRGKHHWTFSRFYEPLDEYELALADPATVIMFGGQYYRPKRDTELFSATTFDNPFTPKDYGNRMLSQYTEAFARQEVYGQFVDLAGLLFTRSDFQFIDPTEVPRQAARVRYWDRAASEGSGSYTVGLLMARDNHGRFIIENVVRGQVSAAKRKELMVKTAHVDAERYDNEVVIYCEQEGGSGGKEQMDQDVLMLSGFPVYRDIVSGSQVRRKDGLVLPGRAKVTRAGPFAAMVENNGVYLVRGKWNNEFLDECITGDSLIECERGSKPIKDINAGELVWTRQGLKKVVCCKSTSRSAKVIEIKLTNGTTLRMTKNHPVWVHGLGKFISAGCVQEKDELLFISTRHGGIATQTANQSQNNSISLDTKTVKIRNYIEKSTRKKSGPFQRDMLSTTSMETLTTIGQKTCRQFFQEIIYYFTLNRGISLKAKKPKRISFAKTVVRNSNQSKAIQNIAVGSALTKELTTTEQKQKTSSPKNAYGAERTSRLSRKINHVAAFLAGKASHGLNTKNQNTLVPFVVVNSNQTKIDKKLAAVVVESVLDIPGEHEVFNMEVEDCHEYFANGILVHNCIAFPESSVADQVDASSGAFNKLAFRNLQTQYNPEQIKSDNLLSQAARLLQLQRESGRRRGTEEPNPRSHVAKINGSIRHVRD